LWTILGAAQILSASMIERLMASAMPSPYGFVVQEPSNSRSKLTSISSGVLDRDDDLVVVVLCEHRYFAGAATSLDLRAFTSTINR
jgi:hypothetical protein